MLRRVRHFSWEQVQRHSAAAGSVAIGAVTLDSVPADACRFTPDGRSALFLDGEIHDAEREGRRLQQTGARLLTHGAAEVVFRGWRAEGTTFLARLNGTFSAAIWDDDRGELHLITDRFGLRPLYVALAAGGCVASSEIKAVLGCGGVPRGRSEDGIAAFFAFGYLFGTETFFAGIRALPPSTCATFRPADADYREARYWAPRPPGPGRRERAGDLADALDTSLAAAVERRAPAGERLGLSLSGGLDARTLLALVPSGRDLQSISLGIEGSIDHRSAARLAELAGVRHRNYVLGEGFLGEFERHLRSMILLTDGHYLDQGIVMPTLPVYRELGIEKLLRGHGGELLHMRKAYAFSLDAEAPRLSEEALERWLFDHLTGYMLGGVPADLFEIDVAGRARAALHTAYLQAAEQADAPIDRVWRLFLAERLHRETALSMHQFNCFAMVRLPYLDPDVVDALLAMPASMKMGDALQTRILRRRRPDFLRVVNSNTGAPVGAGRLRASLSQLRLRVYAKLGVRGYQPYERLGLWLRRELRGITESALSSDRFLSRGLCRADVVRRVLAQHASGEANHTFLIMSLFIFELGQQMLEDPEAFAATTAERGAGAPGLDAPILGA